MPADNAARVRLRILAIFLPVAAVLYVSCEALDPKGTDQVVTTVAAGLKLLAIAAKHPTQLHIAGTLSLLALGALAVSYAAIAMLVTGRGWVIATVAALLGGIGVFQITTPSTGTVWYYEGGTLGFRVVHFYFPRSGIIIALVTNSATDPNTNDDLQATAIAVYQTLQKAGVARAG